MKKNDFPLEDNVHQGGIPFLQLMYVRLKDNRFVLHLDMEETNMCEILDIVENRGIAKGMAKGFEQGIEIGKARGIEIGKEQVRSDLRKAVKYLEEHQRSDEIAKLLDRSYGFLNEILKEIDEEIQFSA